MSALATDRNLLFGILAVQMDFVSERELIGAMNAWVLDKSRPLDELLLDSGALTQETHELLDALVRKHIEQHGGLAHQSLAAAALASPAAISLRKELASLADTDVQTSLGRLPTANDKGNQRAKESAHEEAADSYATVAHAPSQAVNKDSRFTVVRPHAAGGLGRVSVARDGELNREVALKELLDRHADDPNSRERFLLEAEITGGLEHPGVVPIYALGQYSDGRPYYAMRFIRGDSLRQALERFHEQASKNWTAADDQLKLRRLLLRMIDVCHAIEYAHSRGVVHRDLKPGNIMLGQYGETLVVDWGLAKALGKAGENSSIDEFVGPALSEPVLKPLSGSSSAPTQMGAAVGTPAFMSPEQAAGRIDELGPASDVFSLGATLYMVLTGQPPQTGDDLGDVLLRVQRGMFPKPREIKPVIPRGLEAICLKAMALKPADRYASARGMADELESWLADEPVQALPESLVSQARRWIKKHRAVVTSAVAAALVGLVVSWFAVLRLKASNDRESQARELAVAAKDEAIVAKDKAIAAEAEADLQGRRAEELLTLAKQSLTDFEELSKSEKLMGFGMESIRSDLLQASLQYYATLANLSGETEQARADRSNAYYRLGGVYSQKGQTEQGVEAYQTALEMYRQLAKDFPAKREYRAAVAFVESEMGSLLAFSRNMQAAAEPLAGAIGHFKQLIEQAPEASGYRCGFAVASQSEAERRRMLGEIDPAAEILQEAITVLRAADLSHPAQLETADKEETIEEAETGKEKTADKPKTNKQAEIDEVRYNLAVALMKLGALQSGAQWKFALAEQNYQEAESLLQEIYDANPSYGNTGHELARVKTQVAELLNRRMQSDDARQAYAQALEIMREVERRYPQVPTYRRLTADILSSIATINNSSHDKAAQDLGQAQLQEAVEIAHTLVSQFPNQSEDRLRSARYDAALGMWLAGQGNQEEATKQFDASLKELQAMAGAESATIDQLLALGRTQYSIAELMNRRGEPEQALQLLEKAEQSFERVLTKAPDLGAAHLELSILYIERGACYQSMQEFAQMLREYDRVIAKSAKLAAMPDSEQMQSLLRTVTLGSKTAKAGELLAIRYEYFDELLAAGNYRAAAEQAGKFADYTREASDAYLAARVLALAGDQAAGDAELQPEAEVQAEAGLQPEQRDELVAAYRAAAVQRLAAAWDAGYIRQKAKLADFFTEAPSLKTLREEESFATLREREDFQDLLKRIEAGKKTPAEQQKPAE